MTPPAALHSAKLSGKGASWYPYYAGYSEKFVASALDALELPSGSSVLDPWNGSGTTTSVAAQRGFLAWGLDANPALTVIARARTLDQSIATSLDSLLEDIIAHAQERDLVENGSENDLLDAWFQRDTAARVRNLEASTRRLLVTAEAGNRADENQMSPLAAVFYVALFSVVRSTLGKFRTTNPTWIKRASSTEELIGLSQTRLHELTREAVATLARRLGNHSDRWVTPSITTARSSDFDAPAKTIRAVVTSPPYCTRIDYVAATLPELAVLGLQETETVALRSEMLGTPVVGTAEIAASEDWGETANRFLSAVGAHRSKASKTYYARYFTRYFRELWESLRQITGVTTTDAAMVFVVQESSYKEVRLDLAAVFKEMASAFGWAVVRADLDTRLTKAAINPAARAYRASFAATESALICRRTR